MDIKTFKDNVLKAVDKVAIKIHKKIAGPKEYITVYFTGGTKADLEDKCIIPRKHEIVVEIPAKHANVAIDDPAYFDIKCKFKVGDGETNYKDLKYHYGTIPPAIEQTMKEEIWII